MKLYILCQKSSTEVYDLSKEFKKTEQTQIDNTNKNLGNN